MLYLLGYHCLVRRQEYVVTTPAEFLKMVILSSKLAVGSGLEISSHSEGLAAQAGEFGEAVTVVVIAFLLPVLAEYGYSQPVVIGHQGCVQGGVVVPCLPACQAQHMRGRCGVSHRLTGNYVYGSGDG